MLFHADIANVEDDLLEVIIDRSDVLELLPIGQLVVSVRFLFMVSNLLIRTSLS